MGLLQDKVALWQVLSECFHSPANHSTDCYSLIIIGHPELVK
jgi:hypothetical protein